MNISDPYIEAYFNSTSPGNVTIPTGCAIYSPVINLLNLVLYSLVCIVGLCGNTLVIYVVLRFSKMQTVTNIYILNLAIADECFLIGIPFLVTTIGLGNWIFGQYMCKIYMASTSINQFTSGLFLLIMSADRYVAVCHPISGQKLRTSIISKLVSFSAWLVSLLFVIPILLYTSTSKFFGRTSCNVFWPGADGPTAFTLYTFFLGFVIPLIFILFFYYMVIRKLRIAGPRSKSEVKKRSNKKVTKLVLTIVTVYVFCWLPYWATQVTLIYADPYECQSATSYTLFLLSGFLSYSNSAINPILYAFLSENFKKSFARACVCYGSRGKRDSKYVRAGRSAVRRKSEDGLTKRASLGVVKNSKESSSPVPSTSRSNATGSSDSQNEKEKLKETGENYS